MADAKVCPVCNGKGKVYSPDTLTHNTGEETCRGCGGTGWVVVPD